MKITVTQIKVLHTIIFWILSLCVLYSLFSAVSGKITLWTWFAVGLVLIESVVLMLSGWTCPLTLWVERLGHEKGSVADIFLPLWLANRIFPICGTMFACSLVLLLIRVLFLTP
ncbi:hypothetical protein [Spirulina subsalsa]|uniref:hypothetical protein n=1 Tax=Spirulina subsalsa TaxID=54311 RepID=UPI0002D82522|nr:hypothetical protein [Spirulina subsalsa]